MTKLALIGVGRWGKNILRTLEGMKGIEVVAITDAKQKVPDDIKGVLVATPGSTHARVALPYVKRGLPVFIEKPMATSIKDAMRLDAAARKSGAHIFVGHVHLYNPAYLKLKELLPTIGAIKLVQFEGMAPGPVRDDMSVLWDWGPHGVSMMLDLLGRSPQSVQGWGHTLFNPRGNIHDVVQAKLLFAGGVTGLLSLNWISQEKRVKLTVTGANGSLVFDDTRPVKKVTLARGHRTSYPRYSTQLSLTRELRSFLKVVQRGGRSAQDVVSGPDVVRALAVIERSQNRNGARVLLSN